jgi:hypothetical protein
MNQSLHDDLAVDILEYMVENPNAMDEAEGILAWWFSRERIKAGLAKLEVILNDLASQGLVVAYPLPGERVAYSVNKERIDDIVRIIADHR